MLPFLIFIALHLSPPSVDVEYREPQVAGSEHLPALAFGSGKAARRTPHSRCGRARGFSGWFLGFTESITETAHGLDAGSKFPQFSSQGHDMHVDGAIEDDNVPPKHVIDQFASGKHAPRIGSQEMEQPEFSGGEIERCFRAGHFAAVEIDEESPAANLRWGFLLS